MVGIILIATLVIIISLYDHFSSRKWNELTSTIRNNAVFEGRNKTYGAYEIRRNYNRGIIVILGAIIFGGGGVSAAAYLMPKNDEVKKDGGTVFIPFDDNKPKDEEKEPEKEIEKDQEAAPKQDIQKLIEPVVTSDPVLEPLPPVDSSKTIGLIDQKGDGKGPFDTSDPKLSSGGTGEGNEDWKKDDGPVNQTDLTEQAEYIGGRMKMLEFIQKFFRPQMQETTVKVYTKFVVSETGEIKNVRITGMKGDCGDCKELARQMLERMPAWSPGKINGVPTASYFTMPIVLTIE